MSLRIAGMSLIAAAVLFWVSWFLMPGVGVTDPELIFSLVSAKRSSVAVSVVAQLLSAVLYVPALLGISVDPKIGGLPMVRLAAGLLLIGAMGSAADAVLHLLAYAMTIPGLDPTSLTLVMSFMQGPGLLLLAPLLVCFFVGGGWLSAALARASQISWTNAYLHGMAIAIAGIGGILASFDVVSSRVVGLAVLGTVSAAQAWIGASLSGYERQDTCS